MTRASDEAPVARELGSELPASRSLNGAEPTGLGAARRPAGVRGARALLARPQLTPQLVAAAGLWVALFLAPFAFTAPDTTRILNLAVLNGALAVSLCIAVGYAGIFDMSQGTFYGIGAYVAAILVTKHGVAYELVLPAAVVVCAVVGAVIGTTTRRIRGDYWALASMAFTFSVVKIMENWTPVTQGKNGYVGIPVTSFFGISLFEPRTVYLFCLGVLVVVYVAVRLVTRSFVGRALLALRYDEVGATMQGVRPLPFKMLALALSGGLAGLAGASLISVTGYIYPSDFDFVPSFTIMLFVIVGGDRSLLGSLVAAIVLTVVPEEFRAFTNVQLMIYGFAILIAVFMRAGVFSDAWRSLQRRRAARC